MASMGYSQPGGASFSPLMLFESTITSATMLIDNMHVRDLMLAFKIVTQLHGHLVEVLNPNVMKLADIADEHTMCQSNASYASANFMSNANSKFESKSESFIKEEFNSDDDCQITEVDNISNFDDYDMSTNNPASFVSPAGGKKADAELSNEWKAILRKAYRLLKEESGSNVFDFGLPYSAKVNTTAANLVIERAMTMSKQTPTNVEQWKQTCFKYVHVWYRCNLKPKMKSNSFCKFMSWHSVRKLNRRQKSLENIKSSLEPSQYAKYSSVLNRDYTSSDEENSTDLDSGEVRVKSLSWQSEELTSLKRKLDDNFMEHLADEKQSQEMKRVKRDPGFVSQRRPPNDVLQWALKK